MSEIRLRNTDVLITPSPALASELVRNSYLHTPFGYLNAWKRWSEGLPTQGTAQDALAVLTQVLDATGYSYRLTDTGALEVTGIFAGEMEWDYYHQSVLWAIIAAAGAISGSQSPATPSMTVFGDEGFMGFVWEFAGGVVIEREMEMGYLAHSVVIPVPAQALPQD